MTRLTPYLIELPIDHPFIDVTVNLVPVFIFVLVSFILVVVTWIGGIVPEV
jgi:hypothetical protein